MKLIKRLFVFIFETWPIAILFFMKKYPESFAIWVITHLFWSIITGQFDYPEN